MLLGALAASLILAASAAAEVRSGSASDGTEPDRLPPSIDIVAAAASYDTAGSIQVAVTTAAPPPTTSEEFIFGARFGVFDGAECVEPAMAIAGSFFQPPYVAWQTSAGGQGAGTESIAGATTTLAAGAPDFVGQPYNCVEPAIYKSEGSESVPVEGLTAPIQLLAPPPPSPPAPAPSSPPAASPAASPAPAPAPAPTPKVPNLTFVSPTLILHRNAPKKVRVKITNIGNVAAGKVTLTVGKAKGVAVRPKSGKLKLKSIAAGKSKVASFRVKLTKKAKARSKLTLQVRGAHGVEASGVLTLELPAKRGKKDTEEETKEPEPSGSLAEKIFYSYESQASESAKLIGYAFIDDEWAYHGIPTEGLPGCSSETGSPDAEGCVKYKFDPKTNSVQIGSLTGTINSTGKLEVNGETYSATAIPAAGERFQVEQEYIGYSGICGLITGCSTFHEHLQLMSSGEFVLSRESLTTAGGSGPGETFVAAGSYPADQHGTYSVEKGARIKLSFADGSTQTKTFAIFLNDSGQPDAAFTGLLLGNEYFTFQHADD